MANRANDDKRPEEALRTRTGLTKAQRPSPIRFASKPSRLSHRWGAHRTITAAATVFAGVALVLFGAVALGTYDLPMLIGFLLCAFAGLGAIIPTTTMVSLEDFGAIAGVASAVGGTLQMVIGASLMARGTAVFDGSPRPMMALIALCAVGTLVMSSVTLKRTRDSSEGIRLGGPA